MNDKYLVTASGISKKGNEFSTAFKVITCPTVTFLDKNAVFLEELAEVGSFIEIEQSMKR